MNVKDLGAEKMYDTKVEILKLLSPMDISEALSVLVLTCTELVVKSSPTREDYDSAVGRFCELLRLMPEIMMGADELINGTNSVKH